MSSNALPTPPWSSEKPARTPLSRAAITDAALAIVDAEGLDALSMRRLAEQLGTGPASLYAHVSGKDELLQLLIDRVAGEIEVPEPDPERWQEQIRDCAREFRRVLSGHRDLAAASLANIPTGPNALRTMDGVLGILRAGGVPDKAASYFSDLMAQFVTIDVYEGSLFEQRMDRDPAYFERLKQYFEAFPPERYPNMAALGDALMDPGDRFEFGLDLLVRGLAAVAEP